MSLAAGGGTERDVGIGMTGQAPGLTIISLYLSTGVPHLYNFHLHGSLCNFVSHFAYSSK